MKKVFKTMAALMFIVAVALASGCKKDSAEPNSGGDNGGSTPTTEGIYLGVIGFNDELSTKEISLLNASTLSNYESFINNLDVKDNTALYYADYVALQKLTSYAEPPKLSNVALVTFTDGLDNLSTDSEAFDPEGYGTKPAYREGLHHKITTETVHGKSINAYSIGLRGEDVQNSQEFGQNLNALASNSNNVFEATNMSEALEIFANIADSLYSVTTTVSLTVNFPGGVVDDGQHIRFAFDYQQAPNNTLYIEGTYNKNANPRRIENITYHGFQTGAPSVETISHENNKYYFKFENLVLNNGDPISQNIVERIQMWKETSSGGGWDKESEFNSHNNTDINEDKSSAIIMLVLDCTTSLGDDFSSMKIAAERFVQTLISSGGGTTQTTPTVSTSSVTNISNYSATCGGYVSNDGGSSVTERGICWSTSQNPTINNDHITSGTGTGNFSATMSSLSSNTTYYVRAYARNNFGISYGNQERFTTISGGSSNTIYMTNGETFVTSGATYNFYDSGGPNIDYSDNENYTYSFYASSDKRVKIVFNSFNTEANYDFITIDGESYSGEYNPGTFYSGYGATITVQFHSDGSVTRSGWSATVTSVY